jgi:hypothetical protein
MLRWRVIPWSVGPFASAVDGTWNAFTCRSVIVDRPTVCVTAQIRDIGDSSRLPNYENSKLKRKERKSRSAHDFSDTNTRSLRVTLSEVTCPTSKATCLI